MSKFIEETAGISIEFPDLPGCIPCAATMEDAYKNAKEALRLHLLGMKEDGEAVPAARNPATIEIGDGQILVMVKVDITV